jgi:hypothetical protein
LARDLESTKPQNWSCLDWGETVIRQAISCDICATEKKQTNHWFVAYEQGGELRVSGWLSRNRLRPGSKHLCGQTCLHKLVDEFMAKAIAVRTRGAAGDLSEVQQLADGVDTSLTSNAAYVDVDSSARLITPSMPTQPISVFKPQTGLVTMPVKPHAETSAPAEDEPPHIASRNWRAEAWERERARELRSIERRPDIAARRRSSA